MKLPRQLTKRQLIQIVEEIRDILYMSEDTYNEIACSYARAQTAHFANRLAKEQPKRLLPGSSGLLDFLNPDKEWDADTLDAVRQVLDRHRLCPARLMTPGEVYRKPTPNENWKDDSVQFPRLLDELQGIGVVNIMSEAEWECLAAEMDLPSEKIMQIFARAQKEWDRIWKGALVRIYLAGKISQNGWRHAIVQDLRDWAFRNIDCGSESATNWPILIGAIKLGAAGVHDYTGPFFVSCDHGCYHGDNSHGVMGEGAGVCDGPHTPPQEVQDACLRAIDASDLVFAWIEDLTVFGTLIEIGYAIAKRKYVAIAYPEDKRDLSEKLWFAHPGEEALFATSAKHGLIKALGWKGRCS